MPLTFSLPRRPSFPIQLSALPVPYEPPVAPDASPDATLAASDTALAAWLRLALTPGIGPVHGRRLVERLGGAAAIGEAPLSTLAEVLESQTLARALAADDPARDGRIVAAVAWQRAAPGRHHLIVLDDPRYPPRLRHLADPPLLLYLIGEPASLGRRQLAIVGSRRATALGRATATSLATALVRCGWTITSGLAEGIDGAAHEGALLAPGAPAPAAPIPTLAIPTVAVMGTGIDRVYPARHHLLAQRIVAAGGALVTEFAPGIDPIAANFPRRNRLIAALADGVLVVEAARNSGSLITARLAADLGREVLAVPGSIHSPQSRGCHRLLRDGATLVEELADILGQFAELPGPAIGHRPREWELLPGPESEPGSETVPVRGTLSVSHHNASPNGAELRHDRDSDPDTTALLDLLAGGPADTDHLQRLLDWPIDRLLARLQRLEIAGNLGRDLAGHWFRHR